MPGKECAQLPPELWGEIAARLPHDAYSHQADVPNLRLVCKEACKGWDRSHKTVMLKDAYWWPEIHDPTGPEILALLRKMPCLIRVGMNWHTVAGFSAATKAVVQAAADRGKTCQVLRATVTDLAGSLPVCEIHEMTLPALLEFVARGIGVSLVDADIELR